MARVVVLTFMDNDAAESLIADLDGMQAEGYEIEQPALTSLAMTLLAYAKVNAIIARPTAYCKCPQTTRGRSMSSSGWFRTKRFGWYVCPNDNCHRPHRTTVKNFISNLIAGCGYNLLPELMTKLHPEPVVSEPGPELVHMTGDEPVLKGTVTGRLTVSGPPPLEEIPRPVGGTDVA
jgi:hypothetical protein